MLHIEGMMVNCFKLSLVKLFKMFEPLTHTTWGGIVHDGDN